MTLLATFDGPKAVGKSTLIHAAQQKMLAYGYNAVRLVEKDLLPEHIKKELNILYKEHQFYPSTHTDSAIANYLLKARIHISNTLLQPIQTDVIMMDRWYPSDAVFRRYIDVEKAIDANISAGVMVPNIIFAVTCDPEISWQRAHQRPRSLDSKVINNFDDHRETSNRFESIARQRGWHLLRSDSMNPDELACEVIARLLNMGLSKPHI